MTSIARRFMFPTKSDFLLGSLIICDNTIDSDQSEHTQNISSFPLFSSEKRAFVQFQKFPFYGINLFNISLITYKYQLN